MEWAGEGTGWGWGRAAGQGLQSGLGRAGVFGAMGQLSTMEVKPMWGLLALRWG